MPAAGSARRLERRGGVWLTGGRRRRRVIRLLAHTIRPPGCGARGVGAPSHMPPGPPSDRLKPISLHDERPPHHHCSITVPTAPTRSLSVPKERIAEPLLFGRTPRLDQGHAERGQSESRSGSPPRSAVARRAAPFPGGSTTSHVRSPARVMIRLPSACGSVSIAITFCVLMTTVSWASFALPSPIPLTLIGALDRVRFLHIFVTLTVARRSAAPGRRARAASARCNGRAILRGRAGKCTR